MAGLRVGQAFGMFLLPGFGVGSSSPWVPGHPTSMCDSGVNSHFDWLLIIMIY